MCSHQVRINGKLVQSLIREKSFWAYDSDEESFCPCQSTPRQGLLLLDVDQDVEEGDLQIIGLMGTCHHLIEPTHQVTFQDLCLGGALTYGLWQTLTDLKHDINIVIYYN